MRTSTTIALSGHKTNNMVSSRKKKIKKADKESKPKKKKVRQVEEDEAPKKKKKKKKDKPSKELVPVKESTPLTKAERLKMKKILKKTKLLRSNFKNAVPRIHELISEDNLPAAMSMASRGFLIMLTELIPILEQTVRDKPGQSSVYSLNALVSQVREIQADIKADNDQASLAERICEEIIGRIAMEYAQKMALAFYHLREQIRPMIATSAINAFEGTYNKQALEIGGTVEEMGNKMKERVAEVMILE